MIRIDKNTRHRLIRQILETQKVATQEELRAILQQRGLTITQATLSRDLNSLQIVKIPDPERGYIYTLPERLGAPIARMTDRAPLHTCRELAFSGNLAVLKCLPSFAPSVALIVDGLELNEVVCTVAGDDTVLIILKEQVSHERFRQALVSRCPELQGLI